MRKTLLAVTATTALVCASSLATTGAQALTAPSAVALEAVLAELSLVEGTALVCRHRYYSTRRVCWWTPRYRYRPYRWRYRYRRW